ncbi:MAG: PAS domain S-box protein, partial [Flavobacteriales bacterium]|nr:PAS domain S-box protein [Flavobacteriales bacterium]
IVYYVVGIVVTRGRYETAKKLIERENFLKALFNQSYDAFLLVNFYSKEIVDCNNVAITLLEAESKEDIVGEKRDKFKVKPFTNSELTEVRNSLQQKGNWTSEEEYQTIGGRKFPASVVITTLEVEKSNYYVVRITDLSDTKKSEEKLRRSEAKYRNLFERNLAGVYKVRSSDKVLLDCNDAFAKILGYSSKKEVLGEICSDLYIESSDNNQFHEWIKEKGRMMNHESKIKLKNGNIIWAIENTTTVNDPDEPDYVEGTMIDITELKMAQENLQKTERDRNLLLSSLNVVVYTILIYKKDKTIDYISPQVESVFGYTKESYNKGEINIASYYHPDDVSILITKMEEIKRTKQPVTLIYRFNHVKSGKQIWIEESVFPQFNQEGVHIANFGIAQDITERIIQEEALKQSEERFKQLSDVAIEGILFTENGITIDANEQFAAILGYDSVDEIIGKDMFEFISDDSQDFVKNYIEHGVGDNYVDVGKKKDGSNIFLETRGQYIQFGEKQIRASVIIDVDEKIKKEKELQESEQRFKLLADASQEGIIIHDQGFILEVNDLLCNMLGFKKEELLGSSAFDLVSKSEREGVKKQVKEGLIKPYQVNFVKKNKTTFIGEVQAREIPYKGKQVRVAAIRNISQRIESERELEESKERFKEVVENSPDGLIIHQGEQVIYANDTALQIMGIENFEDFVKEPYINFIVEKDHKKARNRMARAEAGEKLDFEPIRLKRSDGSFIDVESKSLLMNIGNKEVVLVVLHDISERLQLEKQRLRAELAEETNKKLNKEIQNRLKTEEELKTTQQYTRSIIESSLDVICATNDKGIVTEFNLAAQKTFGYSKEEVLGKHVSILYVDKAERDRTVNLLLGGSGTFTGEVLNKRKNGEEFISYLAAAVLRNAEGKTIGLMGVSRDITEVKKSQTLLEKSEQQYRDLFENATDLIQSVDADGTILYVNNSWKKTLGYTTKELENKNIFDIIADKSKDHCKEVFSKILKGETVDRIEIIFNTKEGKEIIVEGNISCKLDEGIPVSTRGIFMDVTASRMDRFALTQKEMQLSAIINNTDDLILSIDRDYNLIEFNNAVEKLVKRKYDKEVRSGMSVFETVDSELVKPFTKIYKKVFKGETYSEVITRKEKDNIQYLETFYNPIKDEDGKITGIAIFSQDVTDREINEQEIKFALHEKEILLREVHHRVKNNLQVISSILNLQSSYVYDENTLKILSESQNRIKSMSFIHEILYQTNDFSSIDFQEYILNLSSNLIHSYQIYSDLVDLDLDVDKVLLSLDQAIPCGLVVNELFSNALKYAFEPKQSGNISISLKENNKGYLKLIVADNEKGLPNNFDYKKTESLGLQLVSTLVEQIEGTIDCETEMGRELSLS